MVPFVWYIKRNQTVNVLENRCAASWERVVAFILDSILCYLLLNGLKLLIKNFSLNLSLIEEQVVGAVIVWLYFSCLESSPIKATFGKIFENIQVVDLKGEKISFFQASVRIFFTLISILYVGIGFVTIFFTKYKQGIQDLVSNTIVVRKSYDSNPERAIDSSSTTTDDSENSLAKTAS